MTPQTNSPKSSAYWQKLVSSNPTLAALLSKASTPRRTRYIPHSPTPRQAVFLLLPHLEALFGGAAGGGKSDALLMAALQYVDVPGYAALVLRRTFADLALPGAIMDRSKQWLMGTDARWKDGYTWVFPSGASLTFGYLQTDNDRFRYQSSEFQFIGFDELTQFTETQYRYMFSRLRRKTGIAAPLRMRAATNPGGIGAEWVYQRFLVEGQRNRRPFIPSKLADNPYINQEEYAAALAELDPVTRAQYLEGDWSIRQAGDFFKRHWFKIADAVPAGAVGLRYWDTAATEKRKDNDPDWTAGAKVYEKDGQYYIADMRVTRGTPAAVEALIRQTAELDGRDVEIWMEQEPGSAGVRQIDDYARKVLQGFAFRGWKTSGSKQLRAKPFSAAAEQGNVFLVRGPWIGKFLDEADLFPNGAHDDQVDAASGGIELLALKRRRPQKAKSYSG